MNGIPPHGMFTLGEDLLKSVLPRTASYFCTLSSTLGKACHMGCVNIGCSSLPSGPNFFGTMEGSTVLRIESSTRSTTGSPKAPLFAEAASQSRTHLCNAPSLGTCPRTLISSKATVASFQRPSTKASEIRPIGVCPMLSGAEM